MALARSKSITKKKLYIVILILALILAVFGYLVWKDQNNSTARITNYQECVNAGGGVIYTFEGICTHPSEPGVEFRGNQPNGTPVISNFDDCAAAGNPIMESYPEQCRTEDGRSFTRELSDEEKKKLVPANP